MATEFTLKNENLGIGELDPGMTKRRFEPEGGVKEHNEKIHRESKFASHHKNLPFTFSKPIHGGRNVLVGCINCGYKTFVSKNTVGMICSNCRKYTAVEEVIS